MDSQQSIQVIAPFVGMPGTLNAVGTKEVLGWVPAANDENLHSALPSFSLPAFRPPCVHIGSAADAITVHFKRKIS